MKTPDRQGKTMSSRLLNMKFMQRSAPSSPSVQTPSEPPSKKRKTDKESTNSTPHMDWEGARAAREAEELQRAQALEKHVGSYSQSHWTLDADEYWVPAEPTNALPTVTVGYGTIDGTIAGSKGRDDGSSAEDAEEPQTRGRQSFGNFKSVVDANNMDGQEEERDSSEEGSSQSGGESNSSSEHPVGPASTSKRERRQGKDGAQRQQSKSRSSSHASTPVRAPDKKVSLRGLTSISGRGGTDKSKLRCHACGQTGHFKSECPVSKARNKNRT